MDELRIKKMEIALHNHNRRLDDHDHLLGKDRADIDMLKQIHESQKEMNVIVAEIAGYAKETLDVLKPLAKSFRWLGIAVGWVIKVGGGLALLWAGLMAIWHGLKALALKFGLFA
jgi:hypothetical protein